MRRSKKLIIAVVLAGVLLFGSLGGLALADNGDDGPAAKCGDFIDRVCDIYDENTDPDIDREALKAAFADVRTQMAGERAERRAAAMQERLNKMITEGVITEDQAIALQEWLNDMPEDIPFGPGMRGHGGFRMFRPCVPPVEE